MEIFILATVSLIIATSLFINETKNDRKITFALLCLNVFIERGAAFIFVVSNSHYWKTLEELALILLPAMSLNFTRTLIKKGEMIRKNSVVCRLCHSNPGSGDTAGGNHSRGYSHSAAERLWGRRGGLHLSIAPWCI